MKKKALFILVLGTFFFFFYKKQSFAAAACLPIKVGPVTIPTPPNTTYAIQGCAGNTSFQLRFVKNDGSRVLIPMNFNPDNSYNFTATINITPEEYSTPNGIFFELLYQDGRVADSISVTPPLINNPQNTNNTFNPSESMVSLSQLISGSNIDPSLTNLGSILTKLLPFLFAFAGIGLLLFLIKGGFDFLTSAGDPKKVEAAKGVITTAVIGFIIIITAFFVTQIVNFVFGLGGAFQ